MDSEHDQDDAPESAPKRPWSKPQIWICDGVLDVESGTLRIGTFEGANYHVPS